MVDSNILPLICARYFIVYSAVSYFSFLIANASRADIPPFRPPFFHTLQWLAVEFVFCWFYILETKQRSLEEISAVFDGKEAVAAIQAAALEDQMGPVSGHPHEDVKEKEDSVEHLEKARY
jgi:hypothetical protein